MGVYPYPLGSPGAALHYPRDRRCGTRIKSSGSKDKRLAANNKEQSFNSAPDVLDNVDREARDTLVQQDDGTCASDVYVSRPNDLPSEYYDNCIPDDPHSLIQFLSRPIILKQGAWASTSSRGDVLSYMKFPQDLFGNQDGAAFQVTQNLNKVDGFVAMKAKVRIRVEVNSQPFQAGVLMMHYIPYADYMNSHTQWIATSSSANTTAASGCAHVLMNLANTTSMEFVTPYISPFLFFNLASGQGSFGHVVLSVASALSSAAANSASYTIWANFEDVQLRYPTDAPTTKQYAQVGAEIANRTRRGAISAAVGGVGRAVSDVLPYVGLGWLSSPARMLSNTAEHVLNILGFSKPTVEAPNTIVKSSPTRYMLNADGADTSHKLGLCANNELATISGWAGTDHDEMRLDYVVARPNYCRAFNWSTEGSADDSLFSMPVSPLWTQAASARGANNYARETTLTHVAKVASMFALWRGTMVYTFHVAKTQFHSGRLRISFRPYVYDMTKSTDTKYINMPAYAYTEEIDLSAGTTFTFRVPFVSVRPWMHTQYNLDTTIVSGDARNCATGTIQVSIINPLMAASTVSSTIEALVFVHMEDAQFAVPNKSMYLPYGTPNVAQVGSAKVVRTVESSQNMDIPLREVSLAPYSSCIGETHASLRQLLKRFSYVGGIQLGKLESSVSRVGSSGNGFVIFPWAPVVAPNNTVENTGGIMKPKYGNTWKFTQTGTTTVVQHNDLYSSVYAMYAFFRGSVRIKIVLREKGPNFGSDLPIRVHINAMAMPDSGNHTPFMTQSAADDFGSGDNLGTGPLQVLWDVPQLSLSTATNKTHFIYQPGFAEDSMAMRFDLEGCIEFEVPYHASGHMCPTTYGNYTPVNTRSIFYPIPTVTVTGIVLSTSKVTLDGCRFDVYRAIGDDFSFGGLLGVPKHLFWESAVDPA